MLAFLRWHRETLVFKCAGLTPAQLGEQAVDRSALSLLGLVRHAAESERFWFRRVMAAEDAPPLFSSSPDAAFDVADADARHNGHADLLREQIDGAVGL